LGPFDQYTIQGDAFSKAVLGQGDVPMSLVRIIGNMRVIDAIFPSARSGSSYRKILALCVLLRAQS
jgi:hypothetical protein